MQEFVLIVRSALVAALDLGPGKFRGTTCTFPAFPFYLYDYPNYPYRVLRDFILMLLCGGGVVGVSSQNSRSWEVGITYPLLSNSLIMSLDWILAGLNPQT